MVRYGVSSPPVVPRGSVLILPDRDEPAEVWFETANDLLSRGLTVWVLESAAGRGPGALDAGKGAISRMVEAVIRAKPDKPLVLVAHGLGATLALRAIGQGQAPGVNGAVLSSPALELARIDADLSPETVESAAEWLSRARAGWVMSDWGAVHSATAALTGLDQESGEQLDKQVYFGQPFKEAMAQGQIPKARLHEGGYGGLLKLL